MPAPDRIALLLLFKRRDGERSLASAAIITHLRSGGGCAEHYRRL